jgi:hypothetical protein
MENKDFRLLLSFSEENDITDSITILYNNYKIRKKQSSPIYEKNVELSSDSKILSIEEKKLEDNNKKVINTLNKITDCYLNLYKLLEYNLSLLTDILEKVESMDFDLNINKQKIIDLIKNLFSSIMIILSSKYDDEYIFNYFNDKYKVKDGYNLFYNKNNKNIPIYFVNSFRVRFSLSGLGKIIPYDKNKEFKNEFYLGAKFNLCKDRPLLKIELKKSIKRIKKFMDYVDKTYTIVGSIFNNLSLIID